MKKKLPTISNERKKTWKIFSEYIRRRFVDHTDHANCITCGKRYHWKELQAGHYIHGVTKLYLYFNEKNVHQQCARCNLYLSGNAGPYAIKIIDMYGREGVDKLEALRSNTEVFTRAKLIEIREIYKDKLSML